MSSVSGVITGLMAITRNRYVLVIGASVAWSTIGLMNNLITDKRVSAIAIRCFEYSLFLTIVIWLMNYVHQSGGIKKSGWQALSTTAKNIFLNRDYNHWFCALCLAVNFVVSTISYQQGEEALTGFLGSGSMFIITALSPWLLKEMVNPKQWLAVNIGVGGMAVMGLGNVLGTNPSKIGLIYGVVSAITMGLGMLFLKRRENNFRKLGLEIPATAGLESFAFSGCLVALWYHQNVIQDGMPTQWNMVCIAIIAIASSALPDVIFMKGMNTPPAMSLLEGTIFTRVSTILTPVGPIIFLHREQTGYTWIGGLIVTLSIILMALWKSPTPDSMTEVVVGEGGVVIAVDEPAACTTN